MTSAIAIHPAPPTSVSPAVQPGVIDEAEAGSADARERAADEDVDVAVGGDVDAHRVRRRGRLAHSAHVQPPARAREIEGDPRRQRPRRVDERRLVEQDRPEHPEVAEPEDVERRRTDASAGRVGEVELVAEVRRQAEAAGEDRQREARDDLARAQRDREKGVDRGHRRAGRPGGEHREQEHGRVRAVDALGGPEADRRAEQHHPLDAEVEHPGALGEKLAERGVEQRRAVHARPARARRRARLSFMLMPAGSGVAASATNTTRRGARGSG